MGVDLLFRIAAIGILLAILSIVLKRTGREDIADLLVLAGLVIVLTMVVPNIFSLFESIKNIFQL